MTGGAHAHTRCACFNYECEDTCVRTCASQSMCASVCVYACMSVHPSEPVCVCVYMCACAYQRVCTCAQAWCAFVYTFLVLEQKRYEPGLQVRARKHSHTHRAWACNHTAAEAAKATQAQSTCAHLQSMDAHPQSRKNNKPTPP